MPLYEAGSNCLGEYALCVHGAIIVPHSGHRSGCDFVSATASRFESFFS